MGSFAVVFTGADLFLLACQGFPGHAKWQRTTVSSGMASWIRKCIPILVPQVEISQVSQVIRTCRTQAKKLADKLRNTMKGKAIVKFRLGPVGVYVITGDKNVPYFLRSSGSLSSKRLITMALRQSAALTKGDLAKFETTNPGCRTFRLLIYPRMKEFGRPFIVFSWII